MLDNLEIEKYKNRLKSIQEELDDLENRDEEKLEIKLGELEDDIKIDMNMGREDGHDSGVRLLKEISRLRDELNGQDDEYDADTEMRMMYPEMDDEDYEDEDSISGFWKDD